MKTFSELRQGLQEDVEIIDWPKATAAKIGKELLGVPFKRWSGSSEDKTASNGRPRQIRRIGRIGGDYTVYLSVGAHPIGTHLFLVTAGPTEKIVAYAAGALDGGVFKVDTTVAHPDYTFSKIGLSLPALLYKQIALQYTVQSSWQQTVGGASIWQRLVADPTNKVKVQSRDGKTRTVGRMSSDKIWAISRSARSGWDVGALVDDEGELEDWGRVADSVLILPRKK